MRPVEPEDLLTLRTAADVQLHPAGDRVAFVLNEIDQQADEVRSSIRVLTLAEPGPEPELGRRFTAGLKRDTAPRWSPDGRWLAFLSDRERDKAQLYLMPADGGEARRLTDLEAGAGPAVWSPDGRRVAFAAPVPRETAPEEAEARKRWEQRPRVVTRAQYKADGQGFTAQAVSHLFVLEVGGGESGDGAPEGARGPQQVTFGDEDCRTPAWSPDGAALAYSRNRAGVADYSLSDIWVAAADGSGARRRTDTVGRAGAPSWSPDGTSIAFLGTDDQRPGFGDSAVRVWLADATGGTPPRRLTPEDDRSVVLLPPPQAGSGPLWSPDGASLVYAVADAGSVSVVLARRQGGAVETLAGGARRVTSHAVAGGGWPDGSPGNTNLVFTATDPKRPADVYASDAGGAGERRLTRLNDDLLAGLAWPRVERREFPSPSGGTVEGWLFRPPIESGAEAGAGPLLMHVHGGPHSYSGNAFLFENFYAYVLCGRGWSVLTLNPSGSGSYGKAFAERIRGRWGELDLPEQLGAVDALIAEGIADPQRLAVAGYSYGGYMTSWTVGQTDRFRAAVVGAPVTNLESFCGTSDIGPWFTPFEMGRDDLGREPLREVYRRLSPITYVERVRTPTLILHGEADDRCPVGQGEEFFAGLAAAGRAETEMVRYPGGVHGFVVQGRPSHRLDYTRRVIDWLERHTTG